MGAATTELTNGACNKDADQVKEPWDYITLVSTIPAREAFMPLSQVHCAMPV